MRGIRWKVVVLFLSYACSVGAWAEVPLAFSSGAVTNDQRLGDLRNLDSYFPFEPAKSPNDWARRKERVQRQLLVSLGLWPMPTKTPSHAVIHGKVERDDYTVERVYFESFPGFYVTGSLYRPQAGAGKPQEKRPGILCPHGHWANGRFYDVGADKIKDEIKNGGEQFDEGGRSPLQARCVHLARMGCVVFHYDMIGYADSIQIPQEVAHGFRNPRPDLDTLERWGLFSTQAETHAQSVMGMQTYNSIRALDFLLELPDVDPQRIGVTGASGGGTQTFILGALDSRPHVAFPAVMVSTAMQGGCTCENCCNLRLGTGNVEFAAMFAPRPLGMTAADDWTKEMATKGFPQLQQHYAMLGAAGNVHLKEDLKFGHNYNQVGRSAMYRLFHQHLGLDGKEPVAEKDYRRLSVAEMTVWSGDHAKPESGPEVERRVLEWWTKDAEKQLESVTPMNEKSLAEYRNLVGGAIDVLIGRGVPEAGEISFELNSQRDDGDCLVMAGVCRNASRQEEIPAAFVHPKDWKGNVAIWLTMSGKSGLFDAQGNIAEPVRKLVKAGVSVVGVDLLYQGESRKELKPLDETRRVENGRSFAGYTFGYNPTVFASRVHDVLSVISLVKNHEPAPKRIDLVALDGMGPIAAFAAAQTPADVVQRVVLDTQHFRFGKLKSFRDPDFLPGGAKYGDLPGVLALLAPRALWLAGEETLPVVVESSYRVGRKGNQVVLNRDSKEARVPAAVSYLLGS